MRTLLVLIAQIVLGGYFIYNGYNHFKNRAGIVGYAQARGVPSPDLGVPLTGLMLLGCGISILLGIQVRLGAWLGIIAVLLFAFLVHHYWSDEGMERSAQQAHFMKNLALAAALLFVSYVPRSALVITLGQ